MKVRNWRRAWLVCMVALAVVLAGCGARPQEQVDLRVQEMSGKDAVVHLKEGPVLFVAYWCPHCEHFLATARAAGLDRLPTVVSIWPREGDTLEDVVRETKAKLERTGWGGTPFYVLMGDPPSYVKGTPTLAWWDGRRIQVKNPLEMRPGELKELMRQVASSDQ